MDIMPTSRFDGYLQAEVPIIYHTYHTWGVVHEEKMVWYLASSRAPGIALP